MSMMCSLTLHLSHLSSVSTAVLYSHLFSLNIVFFCLHICCLYSLNALISFLTLSGGHWKISSMKSETCRWLLVLQSLRSLVIREAMKKNCQGNKNQDILGVCSLHIFYKYTSLYFVHRNPKISLPHVIVMDFKMYHLSQYNYISSVRNKCTKYSDIRLNMFMTSIIVTWNCPLSGHLRAPLREARLHQVLPYLGQWNINQASQMLSAETTQSLVKQNPTYFLSIKTVYSAACNYTSQLGKT